MCSRRLRAHVYLSLVVSIPIALASTGCKKLLKRGLANLDAGTTATPALTAAPTPTWKDNDVTLSTAAGSGAGKGMFFLRDTKLDITFSDLPAGTKVASGTQSDTAKPYGSASISVDLTSVLAKLSPRDAFDYKFKLDPKVKVDLDFGGGIKLTLDAPATSVSYGLGELFKKVPDAPVTLGDGAPPKEHTVLFLGALTPEALGPAKTIDAIDWVALEENQPPRAGKTCSGYKKTGGSGTSEKSYVVQMVDQKVTIYEVRTSKPVADKTFAAKNECPMLAFGGEAKTYPSSDEEKAWLRTQRTKK